MAQPKKLPVQTIFMVNLKHPWRPIRMGQAEIRVSKKMTWALLTEATGWPPHLRRATILGKGAFFTLKDAMHAKLGRLEAAEKRLHSIEYFCGPSAAHKITEQLKAYREHGTMH